MEIITSVSNKKIKDIKKLKQKKYRDKEEKFIVEGWHLIESALENKVVEIIITTDINYKNIDVEVLYVKENVMKSISTLQNSSSFLAVCKQLKKDIDLSSDLVILDNIQDPGNLGTILRNSLAFAYKNIILSNDSVDIYNPKTIQASQGAIFSINYKYVDLSKQLLILKKEGYLLIGTALKNSMPLNKDVIIRDKKAFVFGNEGQGIREDLLDVMDYCYQIEIENIDSLNVSSATAIIFYQFNTKN